MKKVNVIGSLIVELKHTSTAVMTETPLNSSFFVNG